MVSSKDFINSIERVASVSLDRKECVKLVINKDNVQLSVNSANSGEGNEKINAQFSSDSLNISFNSKYLIDIASEVEDKNLKMNLKDSVSPVLIEDVSDKNMELMCEEDELRDGGAAMTAYARSQFEEMSD